MQCKRFMLMRNHLSAGGEVDVRPSRVDGPRRGGGHQHIPRGVVHAPHPFLGLARMLAQPLPQHVHLGRKKETGWGRGTQSKKVYDRLDRAHATCDRRQHGNPDLPPEITPPPLGVFTLQPGKHIFALGLAHESDTIWHQAKSKCVLTRSR